MVNHAEISKKVDAVLNNATDEELTEWFKRKRIKQAIIDSGGDASEKELIDCYKENYDSDLALNKEWDET